MADIIPTDPADPQYDPWCDPANLKNVTIDDIKNAAKRIDGHVFKTLLTKSSYCSKQYGMNIYFKLDFMQYTGSFKERGTVNTLLLLGQKQKEAGIVSASTGNHGQSISYHATRLGIPNYVVMPLNVPVTKLTKCENYGGEVILHGENLSESKAHAMQLSRDKEMMFINGYDHPHIIAGQGTIGLEIIEQLPQVDAVICPCGGGSLLAGVLTALKNYNPEIKVYGVQSEKCSAMDESLKAGKLVKYHVTKTIADGLAVSVVGCNAFKIIQNKLNRMLVVKEKTVTRAILSIVDNDKFVVEGAAATSLAAIMQGLVPELKGKNVVCILTGGNIDTMTLERCLQRAMIQEGRLIKFKVIIPDNPRGFTEITSRICDMGANIKDIYAERAWVADDISNAEVKMLVETRGMDHALKIRDMICDNYANTYFTPDLAERETKANIDGWKCPAKNPRCLKKKQTA